MLRMDQVHVIRHKVLVEGRSQRSVARELGLSRNTVAKYLTMSEPRRVERKVRRRRVLEQVAPRLEELLAEGSRRTTKKQRLTAVALHAQLQLEGYEVGVTTVRGFVGEWKRQRREVFIPLVHRAGDEGQVDFFEVTVEEQEVVRTAWKLVIHLPHSQRSFAWLYDRCDQVSFLDGHVRAFAHFGGVPARMVYDNLTAAVRRRVGTERELTDRFQALASHYLFEPCFARPGEGHDKGSVEARGKGIRLRHMSPVPQGEGLEEIAQRVLASLDDAFAQRDSSVWEAERSQLRPLPEHAFEPSKLLIKRVSRQSMVRIEGAGYSVPSRWNGLRVEAFVGVRDIVFRHAGDEYRCARVERGGRKVRYRHYLDELRRKPQAVRQVAPELLEELGPRYQRLWELLVHTHGVREAARVFAKLLAVLCEYDSEELVDAIEKAMQAGRFDLSALRLEPKETPVIEVPKSLAQYQVESARAADFDVLLQEARA